MASRMREILDRFDNQSAPLSVNQMAHEMDITPGVLRGMIDHLVRRGKLREISPGGTACTACGDKKACPFVVTLPVYYERVHDDDDAVQSAAPACWQG